MTAFRGDSDSRQLISFCIAAQEFCIDVSYVREIRGWTPSTPLAQAPAYVRGVINMRGVVLPILDLADRLGVVDVDPTPQHVIIVIEAGTQLVGLLVSAVGDILTATRAMIQATPNVASTMARSYVEGLLTIDSRMISLLKLDCVVPELNLEAA